jgi:hypothetical protein
MRSCVLDCVSLVSVLLSTGEEIVLFIMLSHSLCIHDIHLVHMHAIGVPKGVTLV